MESFASIINKRHIVPGASPARERREEFAVVPKSAIKTDLSSLTLKELMNQDFPDSEWVVNRLIPEGLTVLSAQPASFKTWLLLDIAICIASGKPLFGTFETKQSGVLIIDEENSARLLQQRIQLLEGDVELPIHFMIEQNFKLEDAKVSKIIRFCKKNDIGLITFDSLVRIHSSNENDAVQMSEVFAKIRRFDKAGISVLVTHHNRKTGKTENASQDMRGSSDILAAVDCHLSLKRNRESNRLIITQTKVRSSQELEPLEIEILTDDDLVKFNYIGMLELPETKRTKTIRVVKELLANKANLNQKEILTALEENDAKVNAKTLRIVLKDMEVDKAIASAAGKGSEQLYRLI